MQHATQSSALPSPAEPILASTLLPPSTLDSILDTPALTAPPISNTLALNIPSLDTALGSAFQPASLVALSAEAPESLTPIAQTLLVDAVLRYPGHSAAVVDTTGHFDVVRLFRGVLTRLEGCEKGVQGSAEVRDRAAGMLERVRILRVFDFVGVREAIEELREGLEGMAGGDVRGTATAGGDGVEEVPLLQVRRTEVADSEDEEEDLETEDEEMLFDSPAQGADPVRHPSSDPTANAGTTILAGSSEQATDNSAPQPPLKTILIDNLAHVLTPLLKQDIISANTLATTFLTTLSNLTRTHALHTILLNPCTTPRAPSPSRRPADNAPPGLQQGHAPQPPPPPSIFSSNVAVPALLGLISRYADAHVLVSTLPRRKLDARVYYADSGARDRAKRRGVETAVVAEVIANRRGGRVGAWAAFKAGQDGGIAEL